MNQRVNDRYEVIEHRQIKELNADSYVLRHKKSGAKLFLVSNSDENKVFTIGFRTPVTDSNGAPHIMEHTVLCGSDKYPVKDPFVELVKGSLNTFLNAMTYNDKTVYPVASCNDQDFQNLCDVYLDAVFHPNIYKDIRIFKQEGWHYELEEKDGPLTLNGVVYNEMKGVYSSPESVLEELIKQELYPDTTYSHESGGDPDEIPSLTYEQYLDFHRKYYHPSNSYIYLYGNMDMDEKLEYMDREYLGKYDYAKVDSGVAMQTPFTKMTEREGFYSIGEDEDPEDKTYLAWAKVVGTDLDPEMYIAFQILEYALLSAPGAPLKQAMIDAGIGADVYGGYENGILQPSFSVVAKNTGKDRKEEFLSIIEKVLTDACEKGIDPKSLEAGMNYYEFKYRESDFGPYPKGLIYGLQCFDSWLYDASPSMHLLYEETFKKLKAEKENGYFEKLIRTWLLDNQHGSVIVLSPSQGLEDRKEEELSENLSAKLASMTDEEKEQLIRETVDLKRFQEEPTPEEDLKKIPMLSREDIGKDAAPFHFTERSVAGVPVLHTNIFTSGITYINVLFNASDIDVKDWSAFSFFKSVLGSLNTEKHSYLELTNEINIETGGIGNSIGNYSVLSSADDSRLALEFSAKVFSPKVEKAFEFIREIMYETVFEDEKRLRVLAARYRSRMKERIVSSGHSAAAVRAGSYDSVSGVLSDSISGIAYYEYLSNLEKNFDTEKDELIAKMKEFAELLFTKERMFVSVTADDAAYDIFAESLEKFAGSVKDNGGFVPGKTGLSVMIPYDGKNIELSQKNEGFKAASQVQYVARCGNFVKAGQNYNGALKILQVILSYDYLWIQVRVKGGAYGVMSGFGRKGDGYFVSYRDPNLKKTSEIFDGIPAYLENFTADEREMTKYIIGTISGMDTPMNPNAKGNRDLAMYLTETPFSRIQMERDQVLGASEAEIRALADITRAILNTGNICVVGNDNKIEQEAELFKKVVRLS